MVRKLALIKSRCRRLIHLSVWAGVIFCTTIVFAQDAQHQSLAVKVRDTDNQPIANAQIAIQTANGIVTSSRTNAEGVATLAFPVAANVELSVSKDGLEPITGKKI